MNIDIQSFHHFLDTNPKDVLDLNHICKKENQAEFLELLKTRKDYRYNGLYIEKVQVKSQLQEIEEFFSTFDFDKSKQYETPYGLFTSSDLKKIVSNFIQCSKKNKDYHYRTGAITSLQRLMDFLSAKKENSTNLQAQ